MFTNDGQNALHIACYKGNTSCVEYLLEEAGFNPNVLLKQKTKSTSLHLASKKGHFKIVDYLVDHSTANLRQLNINGDDCLMIAIKQNNLNLTRFLLK
jgi:ankyrin repeat protein